MLISARSIGPSDIERHDDVVAVDGGVQDVVGDVRL